MWPNNKIKLGKITWRIMPTTKSGRKGTTEIREVKCYEYQNQEYFKNL